MFAPRELQAGNKSLAPHTSKFSKGEVQTFDIENERTTQISAPAPESKENEHTNMLSASAPERSEKINTANLPDFETLRKRFTSPYPKPTNGAHHELEQKNEVISRLKTLRELKKFQEGTTTGAHLKQYVALYQLILQNKNESWLVQRQALKNMNPLWRLINPSQRDAVISSIDLRARAHWRKSDRELALMVWGQSAK
jgi:hypothetical protein